MAEKETNRAINRVRYKAFDNFYNKLDIKVDEMYIFLIAEGNLGKH